MNSALRLLQFLERAQKLAPPTNSTAAGIVWALALGLPAEAAGGIGGRHEAELAVGLQHLQEEVALLRVSLELAEVPESLYGDHLTNLLRALSAARLQEPWSTCHAWACNPVTLASLAWAAHFLPREPDAEDGELAGAAAEVEGLYAALSEMTGAPPAVRTYVQRQADLLKRALAMYPLRGAAALVEASERAYGLAKRSAPELKEAVAGRPEAGGLVQRANAVIARVIHTADGLDKVRQGAAAAIEWAEGIRSLIE